MPEDIRLETDGDGHMATQSNIHFYVNWAKERLDEMEAVLASLEGKVGEVRADARDRADKAITGLRNSRDIFRDTVTKQAAANEAAWTSAKATLEPEWWDPLESTCRHASLSIL